MKKSLKVLFLSALVFVLTGCYKVDVAMDIESDGKMDVSIVYAIDKNMMDSMGGSDSDSTIKTSDFKELEDKGFKVEEYNEKTSDYNYIGVKITKSYNSIDDVVGDGKERVALLNQEDNGVADANLFVKSGSVYKSNFNIDLSTGDDDSSIDMSSYDQYLNLKYTVNLPQKSKSNNADETSNGGKTLIWNLKYGNENNIDFEFELGSSCTKYIIIGIVAAVVVAVGIGLFVTNKKKNTTENVENN